MYTNTNLKEEIAISELLQNLFEAYEEIAVMKMKNIRDQVLSARVYIDDVREVFVQTRDIYSYRMANKLLRSGQKSNKVTFSTLQKNGKKLSVFISPMEKFSGDIGYKVFDKFYYDIEKNKFKSDVIIVGFLGKQFMSSRNKTIKYKYYDIKNLSGPVFETLISEVSKYETINVYFGKFLNLLRQIPDNIDLMDGTDKSLDEVKNKKLNIPEDYLFEPSIEGVMHFFEVQMIKAFFKQCLFESELARLGSKMMAMEVASQNTKDHKKRIEKIKSSFDKAEMNKRQLSQLSGISLFNSIRI